MHGRAHGFGRAICGDSKNNYIGYFEKGFKFGLGIEINRKGKVLNQGVFNNLETLTITESDNKELSIQAVEYILEYCPRLKHLSELR